MRCPTNVKKIGGMFHRLPNHLNLPLLYCFKARGPPMIYIPYRIRVTRKSIPSCDTFTIHSPTVSQISHPRWQQGIVWWQTDRCQLIWANSRWATSRHAVQIRTTITISDCSVGTILFLFKSCVPSLAFPPIGTDSSVPH